MSRRPGAPAALLTAAAASAAAGLWLLLPAASTPDQQQRPSTAAAAPGPRAVPTRAPATAGPSRVTGRAAAPRTTTDPLAGAVPDALLQQLLDRATPADVPARVSEAPIAAATRALLADLPAAGWRQVRVQAAAARAAGRDSSGREPEFVDVTLIWAGQTPGGDLVDRRRALLRLARDGGTWRVVEQR